MDNKRYVIVEDIWGIVGRIVTWFAYKDSAEDYLKNSHKDYELKVMTKDMLKYYLTTNNGYIKN